MPVKTIDLNEEFRNDHRFVIRSLITLEKLLDTGKIPEARKLVQELDKAVGPHFKFEEEDLYPALQRFVGEKRIKELLTYHEGATGIISTFYSLLKKERLSLKEKEKAKETLTAFFVHASDCDGLNLLAEQLPQEEITRLADKLVQARQWGHSLTEWKK